LKDLVEMYGACVLTLYEKLGGFEEKCVSLFGFLDK
jgi:hypothetical protein